MDFYINLKVNFRGNAKNFLLSGSETKSWESMEAMVSRNTWWWLQTFTLAFTRPICKIIQGHAYGYFLSNMKEYLIGTVVPF